MYKFFSLVLLFIIFLCGNSFAQGDENFMSTPQRTNSSIRIKNLANIDFPEKKDIEKIIDQLNSTYLLDPYSSSLLLTASAELGDLNRYNHILNNMIIELNNWDVSPVYNKWNAFKAWMWGRILLAADNMYDVNTTIHSQGRLDHFLKRSLPYDHFEYVTWAWAYRAALNEVTYASSKKKMLENAILLNEKYKTSHDHNILVNALWAWIMNLQAAAFASDRQTYDWIKLQIQSLTQEQSIPDALQKNLLTTTFNEYPAWAMAKVRYAASTIGDTTLYNALEKSLNTSIHEARNRKDEYVLAILENQLSIQTAAQNKK